MNQWVLGICLTIIYRVTTKNGTLVMKRTALTSRSSGLDGPKTCLVGWGGCRRSHGWGGQCLNVLWAELSVWPVWSVWLEKKYRDGKILKKSPCLESWPCLCPDASFFEWISCGQWVHPQKKRFTVLGNVGTELYAWCTSFYYNYVYLDVCTCT